MLTNNVSVMTFSSGLDERGAEVPSYHMAVAGPSSSTAAGFVRNLSGIVYATSEALERRGYHFDAAIMASIAFGHGYASARGNPDLIRLCSGPLSVEGGGLWVEAFEAPNGQVIVSAWERLDKSARVKSEHAVVRIACGTRWLRVAYGRAKDLGGLS